jgi:hypothetical protein
MFCGDTDVINYLKISHKSKEMTNDECIAYFNPVDND